jgi:hypothetical protein
MQWEAQHLLQRWGGVKSIHRFQGSQAAPARPSDKGKLVESSWNVMEHGDAREGKWRGNWRMEWVASTFYTTSKRGVSSITTVDAHTSGASIRMKWRPRWF